MILSPVRATSAHTALLLAAGRGSRFDAVGGKLLQQFRSPSHGSAAAMIATVTADNLLQIMPVLAVVAGEGALSDALRTCGCEVVVLEAGAEREMSASLRRGLLQRRDDSGWLIALADMPLVRPATIAAVLAALQGGADIAVPVMGDRRGHPVGFSRRHLEELLALQGDRGARSLLQAHPVHEVEVDDPGIFADIDTRDDLERLRPR